MIWEEGYKKKGFFWKGNHDEKLTLLLNYIPRGKVLDIGAGEGRNSIFLARKGFNVTSIDRIPEGLEKIEKIAKKMKLPIKTINADAMNFDFTKTGYSLILSIVALDFLKFPDFKKVIKKIGKSLVPGGFFYFSGFSIRDCYFNKYKKMGFKTVEKNTFYVPRLKSCQHFFTIKEVKEVFKNFKIILLKEILLKDDGHGCANPHFHNVINVIARKN